MTSKDHLEYFLYRGLKHAASLAAPRALATGLEQLGLALGQVGCWRRKTVLNNLTRVFPEMSPERVRQLADRVYRHLGRSVGEFLAADFGNHPSTISVDPGWETLDEALARGRGAIIATGHIGNFELGGVILAGRYRLLDVVKRQRNPLFDAAINEERARRGIRTVAMDDSGPAVLRHLKTGGVVSLLLDQDAGKAGMVVDWLGQPAATWPGAARLSIRTGCPVVPMALLRERAGQHRLSIGPVLWPEGLTDTPECVKLYLQRISNEVGEFVINNPEQWFWVHRRWKSV